MRRLTKGSSYTTRGQGQNFSSAHKPYSARKKDRKDRNKFIFSIIVAGILIYLLIFWIIPTVAGGLSILNKLKPPATESSDKLPENSTLAPPVIIVPYESTNSGQVTIEGYALPNSGVEIYLDDVLKDLVETSEDGTFSSKPLNLSIGLNNIHGITISDQKTKSLASKTIKIIYDNEKPDLKVSSPDSNITTSDSRLSILGSTFATDVVSITALGTRLILRTDGTFSGTINLSEGENNIEIKAIDKAGNETVVTRMVTYQKPAEPTAAP